jgi:ferredoxin
MLTVKLAADPREYSVGAGQSVLEALLPVHQQQIEAGCHGGGCGVCKIRVLSGQYRRGVMSCAHISTTEAQDDYTLACRTYPESNLTIEVCRELPAKLCKRFGALAER